MKHCLLLLVVFFCISLLSKCKLEDASTEKNNQIELGHRLFFDKNISLNHTKSCASCHDPQFAFTDGYRKSVSALGENLLHNAPSLLNVGAYQVYDWANLEATTLEKQMQRPLFSHSPIELGLDTHIQEFENYIYKDSQYAYLLSSAFPNTHSSLQEKVIQSISAYERALVSCQSNYDLYLAGNKQALNSSQKNGMQLFFSDSLSCSTCHGGQLLTNASLTANTDSIFFNIGLYNVADTNAYPSEDNGLYRSTKNKKDDGKFKVPSLRNVMITAPYMHDGSIATIEEVIAMYERGGRNINSLPNKGDGKLNKNKHPLIKGFVLSAHQKNDLLHFLESLTDTSYNNKALYKNPFNTY